MQLSNTQCCHNNQSASGLLLVLDIHFGIFTLPHLHSVFVHIVKEQGNEVYILKQVYSKNGHSSIGLATLFQTAATYIADT